MRISSIETFTQPKISLVRVRTEDGLEGYGQIAPYHANITAQILHQQIAPHALDIDVFNIDKLIQHCLEQNSKFPGSHTCRAVGGLDTALWDLHGKRLGKSVCELLGGKPKYIDVYGSSMRRDITPKDEAERLVKLKNANGFKAFKIRVGSQCGHNKDASPGRTEEIVPTVRKALGEDTILYVDANSCYSPNRAIEVGRMLEDYNVGHFEEPCPYWELDWTAQVTRALDIPVAGGEQDVSLGIFKQMINDRVVDIVQPDICYIGGISRAMRVAQMAAGAGMPVRPHAANLSMVTVFTAHMLGAIDNAGPLEFSIEDAPWVEGIFEPELKVSNGMLQIPDGPGWGVTICKKWMEQSEYKIQTL